jgi:prefoldin subunit 5
VLAQDVAKLIRQLKEVEEHMGKLKVATKEVKRLQGSMQETEDDLRDLSAQEASLQRQVCSDSPPSSMRGARSLRIC